MLGNIPKEVKIVEVGPRDGLQNEKVSLSLDDKLEYIKLLAQTGLTTIEATSFVRKDKIPQMADAKKLFSELKQYDFYENLNFPCLVPNMIGFDKAKAVGVKEISLFSATSDLFTQKNINCSIDESFERMREVAKAAKNDGMKIRGYISTVFGCPYAGKISTPQIIKVVEKFLDLGVYEISLGDTIGVATPGQVNDILTELLKIINIDMLAMHFHDTRGLALANILVSLDKGIHIYDASSGGLGGCPYAKGATGNVATEDVLYLLESLGVKTGVDMDKLYTASQFILEKVGKKSPSKFIENHFKK